MATEEFRILLDEYTKLRQVATRGERHGWTSRKSPRSTEAARD
jgi:hypothetical protein